LGLEAPEGAPAFLPEPLGRPRPRFTADSPSDDTAAAAGAATLFSAFLGALKIQI